MSERPRDRTVPTVYAHRGLALWLADAALARALGWTRPVPLLAAHLPRAAFRLQGAAWLAACAGAWGRGAVAALDLHADLTRRADRLRSAARRARERLRATRTSTIPTTATTSRHAPAAPPTSSPST